MPIPMATTEDNHMRFIDLFWFILDGDRSSKQIIEEKNISKSETYEKEVPEPVQEAIEQPLQAQFIEEYEEYQDLCGDCDREHEFFE
jgi:hypothetical protein